MSVSGDRDTNLLVSAAEDIQGNTSARHGGIFSRFRMSRHGSHDDDSSLWSTTLAPLLLSLTVIGTAFVLTITATLFSNTAADPSATVYTLVLVTVTISAVIGILALPVLKLKSHALGSDGEESGRPSWRVALASGLLLGLGVLGVSWANTPSSQHQVTASRNYFSMIAAVVAIFTGKHLLSILGVSAARFGMDLCITCLLVISLFLQGEVGQFDLEMLSNATSHHGYVNTGDMDYLWSSISVLSCMLLGITVLLYEVALRSKVHWLYLVICSSIIGILPILVSVAVRFGVWNVTNVVGDISIHSLFQCITAATDSGCGHVTSTAGWLFIITYLCGSVLFTYYIKYSGDSLDLLLKVTVGVLLSALLFVTLINKSGTYDPRFNAASVFTMLALATCCAACVTRACVLRNHEAPQLQL